MRADDVQIQHYFQTCIMYPRHTVPQQLEGVIVSFPGAVPQLLFINRQADMIKALRFNEINICFSKKGPSFLTAFRALRKPMSNIGAPLNGEYVRGTLIRAGGIMYL